MVSVRELGQDKARGFQVVRVFLGKRVSERVWRELRDEYKARAGAGRRPVEVKEERVPFGWDHV